MYHRVSLSEGKPGIVGITDGSLYDYDISLSEGKPGFVGITDGSLYDYYAFSV